MDIDLFMLSNYWGITVVGLSVVAGIAIYLWMEKHPRSAITKLIKAAVFGASAVGVLFLIVVVLGSMYVKVPVDTLRIVWGVLSVGVVVYVIRGLMKV